MTAPWMPPLPEPARLRVNGVFAFPETPLYTADQMRQAQADAARAALEQLEKIIDNDAHAMRFQTLGQYRTSLLAAIRALAREVQHD